MDAPGGVRAFARNNPSPREYSPCPRNRATRASDGSYGSRFRFRGNGAYRGEAVIRPGPFLDAARSPTDIPLPCAAVSSTSSPRPRSARIFGTQNPLPNYPERYNIAPTDPVLVVRLNRKTKERSLDALRWGLVPHWAKDLKFGARCINARAETVQTTPAFRDAFMSRRCLIPASGFYEWKKSGTTRIPYAIVPTDAPLFAFAGLWENWRDRAGGEGAEWITDMRHHHGRAQRARGADPQPDAGDPAAARRGRVARRGGRRRRTNCKRCSSHFRPSGCWPIRQHPGQQRQERRAGLIEPMMATGGLSV